MAGIAWADPWLHVTPPRPAYPAVAILTLAVVGLIGATGLSLFGVAAARFLAHHRFWWGAAAVAFSLTYVTLFGNFTYLFVDGPKRDVRGWAYSDGVEAFLSRPETRGMSEEDVLKYMEWNPDLVYSRGSLAVTRISLVLSWLLLFASLAALIFGSYADSTLPKGLREWAGCEQGIFAMLFADVVGSSVLTREKGNEGWQRIIEAALAEEQAAIHRRGGILVKPTGDGFFAAFPTASEALDYAFDLLGPGHAGTLGWRVGIHVGEISVGLDDLHGPKVHFTHRVMERQRSAGLCVSDAARTDIVAHHGKTPNLIWNEIHCEEGLPGFPDPCTLWSVGRLPSGSEPVAPLGDTGQVP